MSRSDTPSWPPQQSLSPTSPSRSKMTTFPPPGAMEPAVPGLSPNISRPAHPASSITRSDHGDRNYSGQRMPSGGGMGEFGVSSHPQQAQSSSSSSRRALPTQPPSLMSSAMTQNGSFGTARRPLPTPPGAGPPSSRPVEAPISTPRPTVPTELPPATYRRALPILPHPPPSSTRQTSDADAPPPPPPRPLPNISSYFPTAASNPVIPRNSLKGKSVPAGLGRQPSDRVSVLREDLYDSPISLITSNSSPGEYSTFAGPSRQSSQSKSLYHSSSASSFELTSSSHGASTNETQPTSVATSNTGHEAWQPTLDKFEEAEGSGTNVTIRPPSRGPPISPSLVDGRETPTPTERRTGQPPLASLASGSHERHISSSTIGATDADLHETPNVMPTRMLQQRSFVDGLRDILKFPAPDDGQGEPSMSLHSASTSRDSITSDASSGERTPFPEPHPNAPRRQISNRSSLHPQSLSSFNSRPSTELSPSWSQQSRPPAHWVERKLQIHALNEGDLGGDPSLQNEYEDEDAEWGEEEEEEAEVNEIHFFQPAFLSEAALQLKYRIERRRQTKAGITWHSSFTGRDIVVGFPILTLGGFAEASQRTIQDFLPSYSRDSSSDRRFALITAQSLQDQLWFVEVDWDIKPLRDSSEDVFRFMGEMEGMGAGEGLTTELPSGLMTMATRCYSPSCTGDARCYSPRCPFRTNPDSFLGKKETTPVPTPVIAHEGDWTQDVDPLVLRSLNAQQYSRQTVIRQAIQSEVQYEADLSSMEKLFIDGLRRSNPPIITPSRRLESFIFEVFSNAHELHEACRRLIDNFAIRERESAQRPLILSVGDIFLEAATEFRNMYPQYTGHLPQAENVLKKELDSNPEFRLFCERVVRENDRRRDVKYLITRPSTQLQRYPAVLEALLNSTDQDDPDRDFLVEALSSIQNLSAISHLKLFHASKGRGPAGKMQWFDLVPEEQRDLMEKSEQKRQMQIWELIQGEMEYVADLETMDTLFVSGLRESDIGIIKQPRLEIFLDDVFHNYRSLLEEHSRLLENLQNRQLEQHPHLGMISDLLLDAALNWRDAYMEYVTHYPVAKARVQEEQTQNEKMARFLEECLKNPLSNRQDIYHFINRPIPRLLRYNLLLADILKSLKESGPPNHPDIETIPQVMELIGDLGKATQKGVAVNEAKVELWGFQHTLDGAKFGPRSVKDLDLTNTTRELIHKGKVLRQPEGPIGSSWAELIVLLFDNYVVLAKPERQSKSSRREDRQVRYFVNRRPIPLELLSLGNFADAPRARNTKTLFSVGSSHDPANNTSDKEAQYDSRTVWPFTISFIGQGQLGGQYTLWTDSYAARAEWQERFQHAKVLRTEVNDATRVFEMTPLSEGTFWMAPNYAAPKVEGDSPYTGRVTCSTPFTTIDGRSLIAVGCEEGVWIGLRHDTKSLRKVLHVKSVTNIAVLEEFGIFLVLQDKSLLAYHLEALVPSASSPQVRAAPQRLSPGKDIVFFTVGQLSGRTLVLYMKKKGMDSLFRVLEPILGRNAEDAVRQRRTLGNLLGQRTEWFRLYKDFFIPTEAMNVHFLRHKLAVVCGKGFEIMDLTDLKGGSIPIFDPAKVRDRPALAELQRRCDTARPLGMFRSTETEFLLCYDSFGIYVDRHGEPNRDYQAIEWEGRPDSVAFHPPYLLLISAPFVEIRHIDNAKLLQIYTGSDIRLTWDGTGGMARPFNDNPGPNGWGDETSSQEPRIHICQRPDDARRVRVPSAGIGHHVFELTPTLALNNPLLNPVHTHDSNYFPPAPPILHRTSSIITGGTDGYYAIANGVGGTPRSEQEWADGI